MDRVSTYISPIHFIPVLLYSIFVILEIFLGLVTRINFLEFSSIFTPTFRASFLPSTITGLIYYYIPYPQIAKYLLLTLSSTASLYQISKYRSYNVIPLYMFSLYIGDYISPLLLSLYYLFRHKNISNILLLLLIVNEPLFIIPIAFSREGIRLTYKILFITVLGIPIFLVKYGYLEHLTLVISNPEYLLLYIGMVVYSIYIFRVKGLFSLLIFISPYTSLAPILGDGRQALRGVNNYKNVLVILFLAFIIITNLYFSSRLVPNLNGSLDDFLSNTLEDTNLILSLSGDDYINGILVSKGIYIIRYDDSLSWNWSDREEIRSKLLRALEYAENHGIKYVLIDKPKELSFWISPKHYIEYKYPLREPLDRYVIILERRGIIQTSKYFLYLKDISAVDKYNLASRYYKFWSNISIDVQVSRGSLTLSADAPYEAYLHFNLTNITGYYIFKVVGGDGYTRSIEFYEYDGALNSLWEFSEKNFYNPIGVSILGSGGGELVFKIEDNESLTLYLYKLPSPEIYSIENIGKSIVLSGLIDGVELEIADFENQINLVLYPEEKIEIDLDIPLISSEIYLIFIILAGVFLAFTFKWQEAGEPLEGEDHLVKADYIYIYIISIPTVIYLIHPRLLEISWIGGGVFLIGLSMGLFTLMIEPGYISWSRFSSLVTLTGLIFSIAYLIKYLYGDVFDVIGDFWRNQALYSSIDVLLFGSLGLLLSLYFFGGRNIHLHIPFAYLVVSGSSFITDLFRIKNPVLQGLIDIATYFVDVTMELVGYRIEYVTVPAGNALYLYGDKLLTVVILGWPCTGITGIFIFLSFVTVLNIHFQRNLGYSIPRYIVLLGLIITYFLNILRIDLILYLDVYFGVDAAELFHSIGYELIFLAWIGIFFALIYRFYIRRSS